MQQGGTRQDFFLAHSDMISCIAVYHAIGSDLPSDTSGETDERRAVVSTIVCSGELGAHPKVCIWCTETCEVRRHEVKGSVVYELVGILFPLFAPRLGLDHDNFSKFWMSPVYTLSSAQVRIHFLALTSSIK